MTRTPFAVALLAAAFATAAPVPKEKRPVYPTEVGTRWEYIQDGDEKAVSVEEVSKSEEKDGVVTMRVDVTNSVSQKSFQARAWTAGELRFTSGSEGTYDPPIVVFKTGVKEGESWKNKYTLNGTDYEMTCTVGKAEPVTTPAGEFTATPVTHKFTKPAVGFGRPWTYWYAAGVGLVRVTREGEKTPVVELKAFTPGKGNK